MSELRAYDDANYIKETNEVENYLMRIIQRYFDIQNNYTNESIEAMIVESLTRFKQYVMDKTGFIFSLNYRTGRIIVTIQDFGGEQAFKKESAFNKDFGDIADTICEGNDPRLNDKREPIEHVHEISDIKELKEKLDSLSNNSGCHFHHNKNVLDLLKYTGTIAEFDLILLEDIYNSVYQNIGNLEYYQRDAKAEYDSDIAEISLYGANARQKFEDMKSYIQTAITWIDKAKEYTDTKVLNYKENMLALIGLYLTNNQANIIRQQLNKLYFVVDDGEILLQDGNFSYTTTQDVLNFFVSSESGNSLLEVYNLGSRYGLGDWLFDDSNNSFVSQNNEDFISIFSSLEKFDTYTHRVTLKSEDSNDNCIGIILALNEDNFTALTAMVMLNTPFPTLSIQIINIISDTVISTINTLNIHNVGYSSSSGPSSSVGWWAVTNGVTLLIKRDKNKFKIWKNFNTSNIWHSDTITNEINPTEACFYEFDINAIISSYPELIYFKDMKNSYGYCCRSQEYSVYENIWFNGNTVVDGEIYGYTDISEKKEIDYVIPSSIFNSVYNKKYEMFFRYEDDDGNTFTYPLPFNFKTEDGNDVFVYGSFTESGKIKINTNLVNHFPLYVNGEYDGKYISISSIRKANYIFFQEYLQENYSTRLCLIDSQDKNDYIKSIFPNVDYNTKYFIEGIHITDGVNDSFKKYDDSDLTYFNWSPTADTSLDNILFCKDGKWDCVSYDGNFYGFISEYVPKRLSDYFNNPRVYYRFLGTKGV